jgi:uncharacterized protein YlaI
MIPNRKLFTHRAIRQVTTYIPTAALQATQQDTNMWQSSYMFRPFSAILREAIINKKYKNDFMSQICNGRVKIQTLQRVESVHLSMAIRTATGDKEIHP